jgi:hypothetical protein
MEPPPRPVSDCRRPRCDLKRSLPAEVEVSCPLSIKKSRPICPEIVNFNLYPQLARRGESVFK